MFFPTYSNFKCLYFVLCLYTDIELHKNISHKYKKQNRSHHIRTGMQKQTTVIRDAQRLQQEDRKPSCICKKGKPSARMREKREEKDEPKKASTARGSVGETDPHSRLQAKGDCRAPAREGEAHDAHQQEREKTREKQT
jgi:hypothetical protein